MTNYKSLDAWTISMDLVSAMYEVTKSFPREEIFGLTSQLRRASISVPSNIAEGIGRRTKKDTIHFLHISRGSLYEIETLIEIAVKQNYLKIETHETLVNLVSRCLKLINGLIKRYHEPELN